ncbi:UDP-N-acetylmuramate dehydrogenase [Leuconostoc gelidum]|uniref:UDP-N-acetylmuramate dehydrogenase n=1 Tax=Leuconostoc gelidum TaxID=1244 RepID=UPI001CC66B28|nr:UDP-N-acetylmuramate dehydrogenase [Leuconostoc gelidum]MBZ6001558.1 UDP-N-acetylmuramate dehydrogenase [Leuconostoc gelidum subsp. gelidum]
MDNINLKVKYLRDVNLSTYTYTKTGGNVSLMFFPKNITELKQLIIWLREKQLDYITLSGMTNIAVASGNLNFVVVNMSEYNESDPEWDGTKFLKVSASYEMKKLAVWTFNRDLKGLAWMEGIPGTVGAGIYMHAGFLLGQDMQTYLVDAQYLDLDDMQVKTISNQDLLFRYRYSKFQDMNAIILHGRFLVSKIPDDWKKPLRRIKYKKRIQEYHLRRRNNQPLNFPSAGTVFVPPYPFHVGGMLRELNLVGYQIGGAKISEKSPGFIIGVNSMSGEDYYQLVLYIQKEIKKKYNLDLIPEVRLIGFE